MDKGTFKMFLLGITFGLCLYYGFEYDSGVALFGAFISFWAIMII